MDWSNPTVVAGLMGTLGVVVVASVTTLANYAADKRRERRAELREEASMVREARALTFAHRREAYVDFAQTVSRWGIAISNDDAMGNWTGVDFDTFDPIYAKLEMVQLYGVPAAREQAEKVFNSLVAFGGSTKGKDYDLLQDELKTFREIVRIDMGL